MVYKAIPRIVFKNNRLTEGQSLHSVVISLLRGLAAVEVAAAHLRADMYPGLRTVTHPSIWFNGFAFMAGFAHQAVLIFFVISGWLVGGSLLDKRQEPGAFRNYAVDRLTRLWTVLIPTFVVTLLIAMCTGTSTSTDFTFLESLSTSTFVANLFGLQTIAAPPFGENFPLWSLANETWYYVMFALLVATFIARTSWHRLVSGVFH
jgi:peptidoglycan/LPS O-acetylase OafA/YrhL